MAYLKELFNENFLEYASYVVKERAIPHINDGLKPVQRRIMHSLIEMDDGKYNKVANVVGNSMKYHPHGDAAIYSALVVLANKGLFIDRQGNFGNTLTGDPASAARYIECRPAKLTYETVYNPEITEYELSYDGRNKEPKTYPAKFPIALVQGAEGIAVGMVAKILPHNFAEVLSAMKDALYDRPFTVVPDFYTGGYIDVSKYDEGRGRVLVRAKIEERSAKDVVITEIPYGTTTESLIASIESAVRKDKVKVTRVDDYSTDRAEVHLRVKRGFTAAEVIQSLYAFTDCEKSITSNILFIHENKPRVFTVSEVVVFAAQQLRDVLRKELELERHKLQEKLHRRSLELIFVSERIYKKIENKRKQETIVAAVVEGLLPFKKELYRDITEQDVEYLLSIPIRRISAYDIQKARNAVRSMEERIAEIRRLLSDMVSYAAQWIDTMLQQYGERFSRQTTIVDMDPTSAHEAAVRDRDLKYNGNKGYLGYDLEDTPTRFKVSVYDRILVIDREGTYRVIDAPEKIFIGYRLRYIGLATEENLDAVIFSLLYRHTPSGTLFLKRCKIKKYILDKKYSLLPDDSCELLELRDESEGGFVVRLITTGRMKKTQLVCPFEKYAVKGVGAKGYKITSKEVDSVRYYKEREQENDSLPLFEQE
ncbi:DNA topoisomerase IV subunit A [Chitinivibrio alkaliphilus]|uniref:DNA topoisomerase IV subunit A n=1 Tax=Chitinivibrio alkaliphilus ACht1 TaxID=1313304 RepID=U7D880_9BACT|nr:DNA topoisomerase IV subunit A [Chitinivibrio alkaliphilus]ERP31776.1 DNA topoisomerase IV subunit A [Chitinivibrio alkaliphilus ACht1]